MRIRLPLQLRWKVLLVMLFIGITPLVISAWLDVRAISELGSTLAQQSGRALSEQTRASLAQMADNYTRLVDRERQFVELLVQIQARDAERILASRGLAPQNVYWSDAFDNGEPALALQTVPQKYVRPNATGTQSAAPVSFRYQAFFAPKTTERERIRDDAFRLAQLTSLYTKAHHNHSDLIYRQYTALENGLIGTFPGHGGYPEDFDPRQRSWYQEQAKNPEFRWSRPHTDVISQHSLINATMPIFAPNGTFVGVTGIDIRLTSLLQTLALPPHLGTESEVLLTFLNRPATGEGRPTISIVAQASHQQSTESWRELPEFIPLKLGDASELDALRSDMLAGRDGYLRSRYGERDVFCVYRRSGDSLSYLLFLVPADAVADPAIRAAQYALAITKRHVDTLIPLALAIVAIVAIVAFFASKNITEPINELAAAAVRVGGGDFDIRTKIETGDELERLGRAFNDMVPQLEAHTRSREALALASEVQQRLLPDDGPAVEGIDVSGFSVYCDQTGGDYYDFLDLSTVDEKRIAIALGDVAGHGIASALMMTTVRALLHSVADGTRTPADILQHINYKLADDIQAGQFVTLFYLVLDIDRRQLVWASAGHDPAIRFSRKRNEFSKLEGQDIPLGIEPTWRYCTSENIAWDTEDIVLLGTDGVWETRNEAGEFFGKPRLMDLIREYQHESAEKICERIVDSLSHFRGSSPQLDDVTAVVVKFTA